MRRLIVWTAMLGLLAAAPLAAQGKAAPANVRGALVGTPPHARDSVYAMLISTSDVDHVTEVIDIVQQRSKGIPALIRAPAGARWSRVTLEVVPGSALERAVRHQLGLDEPAVFAPWESLVARLRKPDGSPLVTFTFSGAVPLSVTPGTSGAVLAFVVERIEQQSPGQ